MPPAFELGTWSGAAFRHIPANSPYGPLDTRYSSRSDSNRWNSRGEPTLYLAGDEGVLLAEFARHIDVNRSHVLRQHLRRRRVYHISLALERVIDIRDSRVTDSLGLGRSTEWCLDRAVTRATASYVRAALGVQAMLTPSVAFLDDRSRWMIIVFIKNLEREIESYVSRAAETATFNLES